MCKGCWEEAGSPQIDNPQVREAERLISELYEIHSAGGDLHIVLDDWNVGDNHLDFCFNVIDKDLKLDTHDKSLHLQIYEKLKRMNEEERISALALCDGLWS